MRRYTGCRQIKSDSGRTVFTYPLGLSASYGQSTSVTDIHSSSHTASDNPLPSSTFHRLLRGIKAVLPRWAVGVTLSCILLALYQLCMIIVWIFGWLKIQKERIFQSETVVRNRILNDSMTLLPDLYNALIADNVAYQNTAIEQDNKIQALGIDYQVRIKAGLDEQRLEITDWVHEHVYKCQARERYLSNQIDAQKAKFNTDLFVQRSKYEKKFAQRALNHDEAVEEFHAMHAADQDLIDRLVANNEAQDVMALSGRLRDSTQASSTK